MTAHAEDDVAAKVRLLVGEVLDIKPDLLRDDLVLTTDLDVDSLAATELALVIEDEFDIRVPQEVRADVRTYGDIVRVVRERLAVSRADTTRESE